MNTIALLVLILAIPLLLLLGTQYMHSSDGDLFLKCIVFLALSSCLGSRLRMRGFSTNPRDGHYGQTYFRTMTNSGPAMSEHIEMQSMLNDRDDYDIDRD